MPAAFSVLLKSLVPGSTDLESPEVIYEQYWFLDLAHVIGISLNKLKKIACFWSFS